MTTTFRTAKAEKTAFRRGFCDNSWTSTEAKPASKVTRPSFSIIEVCGVCFSV